MKPSSNLLAASFFFQAAAAAVGSGSHLSPGQPGYNPRLRVMQEKGTITQNEIYPQIYPQCGGIMGLVCPNENQPCIYNDPNCDPDCGGRDCLGECRTLVEAEYGFCGGFAGFACPEGAECVDVKGDECSPNCGGTDCGGACISTAAAQPDVDQPSSSDKETAAPPAPTPEWPQRIQTLGHTPKEWTLTSYLPSGESELVPVLNGTISKPGLEVSRAITALFDIRTRKNRVSGSSGCNSYSGLYIEDAPTGELSFSDISSTERWCNVEDGEGNYASDEALMTQEYEYTSALSSVRSYVMTEDMLKLYNEDGILLLSYVPASMSTIYLTFAPSSPSVCVDVTDAYLYSSEELHWGDDGTDIWYKYEITSIRMTVSSLPDAPADMAEVRRGSDPDSTPLISQSTAEHQGNEQIVTMEEVILPESHTSVVLAAGDSVNGFCGTTYTLLLPTSDTFPFGQSMGTEETERPRSAAATVSGVSQASVILMLIPLMHQCLGN